MEKSKQRSLFISLMLPTWISVSQAQQVTPVMSDPVVMREDERDVVGLQLSREIALPEAMRHHSEMDSGGGRDRNPPAGTHEPSPKQSPGTLSNMLPESAVPSALSRQQPLQTGLASWYGRQFHGKRTASGEVFNARALTAAHPSLPMHSWLRVTNRSNGRQIVVRVNDRGPYHGRSRSSMTHHPKRILDVSEYAAELLGFKAHGTAQIEIHPLTQPIR